MTGSGHTLMQNHKTYYSIREVCAQTGLEPHVLRYWESEFPQLRPKKNRAGNRAYREKDIELIFFIKTLLYEEKYTISGAKKKLSEARQGKDDAAAEVVDASDGQRTSVETVQSAISELKELLRSLQEPAS